MNNRRPFARSSTASQGQVRHGPFKITARRFGIEELLERWTGGDRSFRVVLLSSYLSLASQVGLLYTLNFSLMRAREGSLLRSDCFRVERDALGDDVHYVRGPTSKTVEDDDAHWIVSASVKLAVEMMQIVAQLRTEAAAFDAEVEIHDRDKINPPLQTRSYEPWSASSHDTSYSKQSISFGTTITSWPKLLDREEIRITEDDLKVARQFTFNLDPERFAVGKTWPFAYHQLRRTGAVNMLGSGLVSDASLQYQLKHASRAMSRYYGQNYHRVTATLDEEARGFYLREMYAALVREFSSLRADRFLSPHGEKRKDQILSTISDRDHVSLIRDAQAGRLSYRENFMGGCAKPGSPCDLGGISNVSGCMGHGSKTACEHLLLDRGKRSAIESLRSETARRIDGAAPGSMLLRSLQAQHESIERALNAIDRIN